MAERTLIVSATNTLARGYALVPTDRKGEAGDPVNGLFSVARGVIKALGFKMPARAVAVIESADPPATWPAMLKEQLPKLPAVFEAFGIKTVRSPDELHVVASYAQAAVEAGDDVVIVGMDKRLAQLVSDRVWWYDANKDARYTIDMVVKRFGVAPEKVGEWLALVGNPDDAIPGVAGIGAKGATELLTTHGTVAGALAVLDSIKGRAGNALRAAKDQIPAELVRTKLERDRSLPLPLADLGFKLEPAAKRNALWKTLGFVELLSSDGGEQIEVTVCESTADATAALAQLTPPVSIHAVTEDPSPVRGALHGIALATVERAFYFPVDQLTPGVVAWLADARIEKIGHDTKVAIAALRKRGIEIAGIVGDTAVASHLAEPSNWAPHELSIVAKHVLGRALPAEDSVRGVGQKRKAWSELPVDRTARFAGTIAQTAAEVWRAMQPKVPMTLHTEYMELSQTLVRMELAGIGVDDAELTRAEEAFAPIEAELEAAIYKHAGHEFNIGSTKQLGEVLFAELKLPIVSHTKTGWSTANEALERIDAAHPIVPLVIRWRGLRRMTDSWITALRNCIDPDARVHSCFHPARSFSGRIVNTNPDLGRVPGRTPEMQRIRRAFVARDGHVLMSVDYNQLGLHVLAHLTKDPALVEPLCARADVHAQTAAAVLEKSQDAITPDERQLGKVINFATFAGQGASALALQLNMTAAETKELIARFDRKYSKVREFQDEQNRLAHERGYIVTIAGRHWPIGGLSSLDPHDRSYAERLSRRATHEGSVCDVSRRGLLDADKALRKANLRAQPLVQILDEVLFEVPIDEVPQAAKLAGDAMLNAFALEAPLRIGIEIGPNWADLTSFTP